MQSSNQSTVLRVKLEDVMRMSPSRMEELGITQRAINGIIKEEPVVDENIPDSDEPVSSSKIVKTEVPFTGPLAPLHIQPLPHNKAFTCDICLKGVGTKGGLKYHIQAHLNGRRFKCDKCPKSYATKNDLETHYKRHLQQFTCDHCDKKFSAKDYLLTHISFKHLPKIYPCVNCCAKPTFHATAWFLKRHYRAKKIRSKVNFVCKLCGMCFNKKNDYEKHCKNRELLKNKCGKCGVKFPCYKLLINHSKKEHGPIKQRCPICNNIVRDLAQHQAVRHTLRKCRFCNDFESCRLDDIFKHMRMCGTEEQVRARGLVCTVCNQAFRIPSQLFRHKNKAHPAHWCDICHRGYHTRKTLLHHKGYHSYMAKRKGGGTPYRCLAPNCSKYFYTRNDFEKHFRSSVHHHGKTCKAIPGRLHCDNCCSTSKSKRRMKIHQSITCPKLNLKW